MLFITSAFHVSLLLSHIYITRLFPLAGIILVLTNTQGLKLKKFIKYDLVLHSNDLSIRLQNFAR